MFYQLAHDPVLLRDNLSVCKSVVGRCLFFFFFKFKCFQICNNQLCLYCRCEAAGSYNTLRKLSHTYYSQAANSYNFSDYAIYPFSVSDTACAAGPVPTQVCFISLSCLLRLADKRPDVVKRTDQTTPTQLHWGHGPLHILLCGHCLLSVMISGSSIWCCEEFWEIQPHSSSWDNRDPTDW